MTPTTDRPLIAPGMVLRFVGSTDTLAVTEVRMYTTAQMRARGLTTRRVAVIEQRTAAGELTRRYETPTWSLRDGVRSGTIAVLAAGEERR